MKHYLFYIPSWNVTVKTTCTCKREAIACVKRHLGLMQCDHINLIGVNL